MSELTFGLFKGNLIHVSDANNGQKCECFCPHCNSELIARQGKINNWCFAHKNKIDCEYGQESAIHKFAKDTLAKYLKIKVPMPISSQDDSKYISFTRSDLEKRIDDIIPDVILYYEKDGYEIPLLVEVYVTHAVDEEKESKIKLAKLSTIEIDLSKVDFENFDSKNTEDLIINGIVNKKWIYNNAQAILYTNATEKVIIAENSYNIIDVTEARKLTSKMFEGTEKIELISRLNLVEENIDILKEVISDVEKAESSHHKYHINHANELIQRLPVSVDITDLRKRINVVMDAIEEAVTSKATEAVVKAEVSNIQSDVLIAENLINEILNEDSTMFLTRRLKIVQSNIDEKAHAILVANATDAVIKAEESNLQSDVYLAEELVKILQNGDNKLDLNTRLNFISSIIEEKAKDLAILKATDAIIKSEISNLQSDVNYARRLIDELSFNNKILDLTVRLNRVQSVVKNIEIDKANDIRRRFYNHIQPTQLYNAYKSIRYSGNKNIIICYSSQNGDLKAEPNLCGKNSCNKCKKFISDSLYSNIENTCYVVRMCSNYKMNIIYILAYLKDKVEDKEENSTQLGFFT